MLAHICDFWPPPVDLAVTVGRQSLQHAIKAQSSDLMTLTLQAEPLTLLLARCMVLKVQLSRVLEMSFRQALTVVLRLCGDASWLLDVFYRF